MGDLAKLPPAPARQVSGGLDQPLLQRMIEHAPVAIALIAGREYRFVYANPRYEAVAGVPAAVLLGRTVQDVTPGAAEAVAEACATGRMLKRHAQDLTAGNAGPAFWDVSYVPIPDADGTIDAVMMLALDVTEQRLAQRKAEQERVATEQAQRLLDGLMAYLPEGITIATPPDVTLLRVSAYGHHLLGLPPEAVEGMSLEQHITMLDVFQADGVTKPAAAALPLARTTCLGDVITDEELVIRRPDGRWITVSCNAGPIRDAEGHITHGVIAWRDITHLKRVEEALRWETQFRLLFEQAAVGIEVVDPEDGHLCTVNAKWYDMLGYTEQDLIGRSFRDFTAVEDLPEEERLLGRLVAGDISSYTLEKRYLHKDGAARWVRLTSSIVRHPSLPQAFRLSVVEDVTERKIAELALRHALAEAPFPVMLHAEDGTVLQLSRSWTEITGYTAEDLLTIADWTERAYGARREVVRAEIDRLYAQERRTDEGEHVVTTAQGTQRIWKFASAPLGRDAKGRRLVVSMAADITEHKAAEQALRAKMTELETVLEAVPAIVWIAEDPECQRITGSRAAHRVLRLPADANLSLTAREPEKPQHFRVLHEGIEISPEDLPVQRAARGIEVQDFEADIVFDDGTVRHLIGNATPLRDAAGGIHGAVGAFIDITERKAAEKQLRLLVAELSHRVKNVLAVVQALAAQTLARSPSLEAFGTAFQGRLQALARAHGLILRKDWAGVDLHDLAEEELAPYGAAVRLRGDSMMLRPKQGVALGLILHELATNAAKYGALSRPDGRIDLAWAVQGNGALRRVRVIWQETGVGPQSLKAKGFGTRLVRRSAVHDLDGTADVRAGEDGLAWELTFPLTNAGRGETP